MAITTKPDSGYLSKPTNIVAHDVMVFDNRAYKIHKVIVHQFRIGDVEDPDLYAAQPLWEWQESEMGKFVMAKSVEPPVWHRQADPMNYGYQFAVEAFLKGADYSFWVLKWGNEVDRKNTFSI
jgi:hypothetical protein